MLATILDTDGNVMAHAPVATCSRMRHNGEVEFVGAMTYRMTTQDQLHAIRDARTAIVQARAERAEFWASLDDMPAPDWDGAPLSFA